MKRKTKIFVIIFIIGIFVMAGLVYASTILYNSNSYESNEDGLVLDLDLSQSNYNSSTDTFTDDSGEGNDGVSVNAATFTTDKYGKSTGAMSFNGVDDYVNVSNNGNSLTILGKVTVEAWVKPNTITKAGPIVYKNQDGDGQDNNDNYHLNMDSSGRFSFRNERASDGADFTSGVSSPAQLGNWYHVVGVYDENYLYIYVNGDLASSNQVGDYDPYTGGGPLQIGSNVLSNHGTITYFNGSISSAKIYNRALSADEITQLYNDNKPKLKISSLAKGLAGHWTLDAESYNSNTERITDKTPYENHGTNYGATLTTDRMGQGNRAMDFDGGSDWIQVNGDVGVSGAMTIEFWFKTPNKNANQYFFDNRDPGTWWFIKNYTGGTCGTISGNICFENRVMAQDSDWNINEWTHLAVIDDTTTAKMYINGKLVDTGTGESTTISTNLRFGTRYTNSGYFDGTISDVRIYNRALSIDEIDTLYHSYRPEAASGSLQKGLVLDMPLDSEYTKDETVGSEIMTDRTPYSNDGQNYGATVGSDYTSFDGVDDYVTFNSITLSNESATISWWMSPSQSSIDNGSYLFTNTVGDSYYSHILNNYAGKKLFIESDTNCNGPYWNTYYTKTGWHHWTVVFDNALAYLYIDGVLEGEADSYGAINCTGGTATSVNNDMTLSVIGYKGTYVPLFNGSRDEVRIYNRALSESEIKLLYDKGR